MDETEQAFRRIAQLQGIEIAAARLGALAQTLARQLAAERAATCALEFETEPAALVATLARGAR